MTTGQTPWPHLIADLKAKRAAIDQIIVLAESNFTDRQEAAATSQPEPARRARRAWKRKVKKVRRAQKEAAVQTAAAPRAARTNSIDLENRILTALKGSGAISPVKLAERLNVHKLAVRKALKTLAGRRSVVLEGQTLSRVVRLAGGPKEGL